jgi:hypothetical protein
MDPLHITEFASPRYFDKLKQLNRDGEAADHAAASSSSTATATLPPLPAASAPTFTLPLGRQRSRDDEGPALVLRPSEQKKRSLGHDLTALRTQRRPSFTGSFGSLRSKVTIVHKTPSIVEHHEWLHAEDPTAPQTLSLSDLFLALPNELQAQIIAPLPIHSILTLRLVSKSFHTVVTMNESTIARYHATHSLPAYAVKLYPMPDPSEISLHYLCSVWHRLNVASKLAIRISDLAQREIFLKTTEAELREFAPHLQRMRQRLMPLVFTIFHFFETYRDLHVKHLLSGGVPLNQQAFTMNPIEAQVMAMYDDRTLLKVHEVFPLVMSSFSRRLRPPSYAGRVERTIKGYLKDKPADEIYAAILDIGGLRQAQRFWETKGYNARRAAVDIWYGFITREPIEPARESKISRITHLGRRKAKEAPTTVSSSSNTAAEHGTASCNEWFCVKPQCQAARKRHSTDNLVFHSSLAAGPPMLPLTREALRLVLQDPTHLQNIWVQTAEAMILERRIVGRPQDIKRNSQVLLDLIREDGGDQLVDWSSGIPPEPSQNGAIRDSQDGGVSD